jgi:hypothetical protein
MRFLGLDRVRAAAMLLGVVYHATYAFMPGIGPYFPVQAEATWSGFSVLAGVLHSMRMPVFFAVSGFFAALVMERRRKRFLADRFRRLMVPFFVALPFSIVADVLIRRASLAQGTMDAAFPNQGEWLFRPLHLWFLEYVFLFCGVAWLATQTRLSTPLEKALRVPELLLVGSVLTAGSALMLGEAQPAFSFIPSLASLTFFGPFYWLGWALHGARRATAVLQRRGWWMAVAGLGLALFVYSRPLQWQPLGQALGAGVAWLMALGVMGVALRGSGVAQEPGVLVQSAYWVYLVHHPLVQVGQVLVGKQSWPAWAAYGAVVAGAFGVSFVTFLLVRRTRLAPWVGASTRRAAA